MARDGVTGVYTRVANSFSAPATGTTISSGDAETLFDDVEAALNDIPAVLITGTAITLGGIDPHPSTTAKVYVGNASGVSAMFAGQSVNNGFSIQWNYNATPASAAMAMTTVNYSNPISMDGSALNFNVLSGGLTTVYRFATKAPVTLTGTSGSAGATDNSVIVNASGAFTLTLPAASTNTGRWIYIKSIAAQTIISASSNVVPRAGGAAGTALLASGAGNWVILQSDATSWITMAGS